MAAGIAARILDIRKDKIKESLSIFQNVEHRLEFIARIHGVDFINDSKATNVNSAWYALESMSNPVIWIAGGIDKGNDYKLLKELVSKKVKAIICLGKDNSKLKKAFERTVEIIVETTSMDEAVKYASSIAKKDEIVLLSPACASFDLYENFEERGRMFKAAVNKL
jgi:UDP-N-acetylmuramoylalanine--D-glutamate ligase